MSNEVRQFSCIVKCSNGHSNPTILGEFEWTSHIDGITFAQESVSTAQTQRNIFDLSVNKATTMFMTIYDVMCIVNDRNKYFTPVFFFSWCRIKIGKRFKLVILRNVGTHEVAV